jgi:hypothetical protein
VLATSGAVLGRRAAKRAGNAELRLKHISAHTGMSAAVYWDANKLGGSTGATGLTAGSAFVLCVPKALGTYRH